MANQKDIDTSNPNIKELPSKYNPHGLENKWYKIWEEGKYFSWKNQPSAKNILENSTQEKNINVDEFLKEEKAKGRQPFSMVIPPPNVTGSLHLGHALNHTIQDILSRYHRMKGDLTLWLPGTDHAGIATQNVVEKLLAKDGKKRWDMSREDFEKRVWEWKAESGGMITHQQRQLGESVDWDYERFTLDDGLSKVVKKVFVNLHKEKLIYRSERIINWCPRCTTALSNIEVDYHDKNGKFYYIKYPLMGRDGSVGSEYLMVATTRPETILGDEALAIHPEDERYLQYIGRKAVIPMLHKEIPVISDFYVDKDFGTGVVKITPAHDPNDFEVGARHNLPITRVMDDHGKMNELAGPYAGKSREECRKLLVKDLETQGLLEKVEDIKHAVGECYRCNTVVEPITSLQWFVDVKPLAEKGIEEVKNGNIEFVPKRWENTYFEWMNNIQDWCISRQLWWGHRIPAWYCQDCGEVIVSEETPSACTKCQSKNLKQDEDVLDTWFSSGLWPFATLWQDEDIDKAEGWPAPNLEQKLFYPTSVLVTGFDIIFFWVARMIMMGLHFKQDIPFQKIYIHGLVRDAGRQKMSKSKGNVVNPLEKMEEYGTDAFRFFMMSILPEGKDIVYDESRLKGYAAFCNKIWNTARYIWMNQPADYKLSIEAPKQINEIDNWILTEFNIALKKINLALEEFRFADYAQTIYDFIWKSFCSNYIEMSKISLKDENEKENTLYFLNKVFIDSLKLLHPIMPYITEELYSYWGDALADVNSQSKEKSIDNDSIRQNLILVSEWPKENIISNDTAHKSLENVLHVLYKIRNLRGELNLPPKEKYIIFIQISNQEILESIKKYESHLLQLGGLKEIVFVEDAPDKKVIKSVLDFGTVYLDAGADVDTNKEKKKLLKEKENLEKYLSGIEKKLGNSNFVDKAPKELVETEQKKAEATKEKLEKLNELLSSL